MYYTLYPKNVKLCGALAHFLNDFHKKTRMELLPPKENRLHHPAQFRAAAVAAHRFLSMFLTLIAQIFCDHFNDALNPVALLLRVKNAVVGFNLNGDFEIVPFLVMRAPANTNLRILNRRKKFFQNRKLLRTMLPIVLGDLNMLR